MVDAVSIAPVVGFGATVLQNLVPMAGLAIGGFLTYAAHRFVGVQFSQTVVGEIEKMIDDEAIVLIKSGASKLETVSFHAGSDAVTEIAGKIVDNFPKELRKLGWSESVIATKVAASLHRYAGYETRAAVVTPKAA